jgi:hypothetical protein
MTRRSEMSLHGRPEARTEGLLVQPIGDEAVVYDQRRERVHALDATAYRVWTACDGARTVGQVASETGLALPEVVEMIAALQARDLLTAGSASVTAGDTRRDLLERGGRLGAMAVGGAVIATVVLPPALAMASTSITVTISGTNQENMNYEYQVSTTGSTTTTLVYDQSFYVDHAGTVVAEGNVNTDARFTATPNQGQGSTSTDALNFINGLSETISWTLTDHSVPSDGSSGTTASGAPQQISVPIYHSFEFQATYSAY